MHRSYNCVKEDVINEIDIKMAVLEVDFRNIKTELGEIRKSQKLMIQLIVGGLVGLLIEVIGLLVGLLAG